MWRAVLHLGVLAAVAAAVTRGLDCEGASRAVASTCQAFGDQSQPCRVIQLHHTAKCAEGDLGEAAGSDGAPAGGADDVKEAKDLKLAATNGDLQKTIALANDLYTHATQNCKCGAPTAPATGAGMLNEVLDMAKEASSPATAAAEATPAGAAAAKKVKGMAGSASNAQAEQAAVAAAPKAAAVAAAESTPEGAAAKAKAEAEGATSAEVESAAIAAAPKAAAAAGPQAAAVVAAEATPEGALAEQSAEAAGASPAAVERAAVVAAPKKAASAAAEATPQGAAAAAKTLMAEGSPDQADAAAVAAAPEVAAAAVVAAPQATAAPQAIAAGAQAAEQTHAGLAAASKAHDAGKSAIQVQAAAVAAAPEAAAPASAAPEAAAEAAAPRAAAAAAAEATPTGAAAAAQRTAESAETNAGKAEQAAINAAPAVAATAAADTTPAGAAAEASMKAQGASQSQADNAAVAAAPTAATEASSPAGGAIKAVTGTNGSAFINATNSTVAKPSNVSETVTAEELRERITDIVMKKAQAISGMPAEDTPVESPDVCQKCAKVYEGAGGCVYTARGMPALNAVPEQCAQCEAEFGEICPMESDPQWGLPGMKQCPMKPKPTTNDEDEVIDVNANLLFHEEEDALIQLDEDEAPPASASADSASASAQNVISNVNEAPAKGTREPEAPAKESQPVQQSGSISNTTRLLAKAAISDTVAKAEQLLAKEDAKGDAKKSQTAIVKPAIATLASKLPSCGFGRCCETLAPKCNIEKINNYNECLKCATGLAGACTPQEREQYCRGENMTATCEDFDKLVFKSKMEIGLKGAGVGMNVTEEEEMSPAVIAAMDQQRCTHCAEAFHDANGCVALKQGRPEAELFPPACEGCDMNPAIAACAQKLKDDKDNEVPNADKPLQAAPEKLQQMEATGAVNPAAAKQLPAAAQRQLSKEIKKEESKGEKDKQSVDSATSADGKETGAITEMKKKVGSTRDIENELDASSRMAADRDGSTGLGPELQRMLDEY